MKTSVLCAPLCLLILLTVPASSQWEQLDIPGSATINTMLAAGGAVYASTPSGFFRSTDAGLTWTIRDTTGYGFRTLVRYGGSLYGGHSLYIVRSTDDGATWWWVSGDPSGAIAEIVNILHEFRGDLYAGVRGNGAGTGPGLYVSTNGGTVWLPRNGGLPVNAEVSGIASIDTVLFVKVGAVIYRSYDRGVAWSPLTMPATGSHGFTRIASKDGYLFALFSSIGFDGGQIATSADTGNSWTLRSDVGPPVHSATSFISAAGNLYFTTVGGASPGETPVMRSIDNGENFSAYVDGLPPPYQVYTREIVASPEHLFLATGGFGAWRRPIQDPSTATLPVRVVQGGGGSPETPVANDTVLVGRLTPSDPFNPSDFTPMVTDDEGVVLLDPGLFSPGDEFLLMRTMLRRPSLKYGHEPVDGIMYEIVLDNLETDSTGALRPERLEAASGDTTTAHLNRATLKPNLVVSIEWRAEQGYVDSLVEAFRKASNYLYDVTNGQAYLGNVSIHDNGDRWLDADIRIHASNQQWPMATVFGLRFPRGSMELPPRWFGSERSTRNGAHWEYPQRPNDAVNYRTMIHELGHLGFGFYDEYMDAAGNTLTDNVNYGFMDSQYPSDPPPMNSEMSAVQQAGYQSTKQWQVNGTTCWDHFRQTFSTSANGLTADFRVPADVGPQAGLNHLPGPNDSADAPDIDVGAATVVTASATGSSAPGFETVIETQGGIPIGNMRVLLTSPDQKPLLLGGTADLGGIRALGANIGDTLTATGVVFGQYMVARVGVPPPVAASLGRSLSAASRYTSTPSAASYPSRAVGVAVPIAGSFEMLAEVTLDAAGIPSYRVRSNRSIMPPPGLAIHGAGVPVVTSPLTGDSSAYTATLGDSLSADNIAVLTAHDSLAAEFPVFQNLSFHTIDSVTREVLNGPNGARFAIDSAAAAAVNSVAVLGTDFPPLRTGLADSLIRLSRVVAIHGRPSSSPLAGRLTMTYERRHDSAGSIPIVNAAIFRWSNGWTMLPTGLDTAHNTATASIAEGGIYAVYLVETLTGIGDGGIEGDGNEGPRRPGGFRLEQNYPNPFNPATTIRFRIRAAGPATLKVYDVLGTEVASLVDGVLAPGDHEVTLDASSFPGGVYFYKLVSGRDVSVRKMLLMK